MALTHRRSLNFLGHPSQIVTRIDSRSLYESRYNRPLEPHEFKVQYDSDAEGTEKLRKDGCVCIRVRRRRRPRTNRARTTPHPQQPIPTRRDEDYTLLPTDRQRYLAQMHHLTGPDLYDNLLESRHYAARTPTAAFTQAAIPLTRSSGSHGMPAIPPRTSSSQPRPAYPAHSYSTPTPPPPPPPTSSYNRRARSPDRSNPRYFDPDLAETFYPFPPPPGSSAGARLRGLPGYHMHVRETYNFGPHRLERRGRSPEGRVLTSMVTPLDGGPAFLVPVPVFRRVTYGSGRRGGRDSSSDSSDSSDDGYDFGGRRGAGRGGRPSGRGGYPSGGGYLQYL
ncbi:hypothetical protein BJ508DRAFT_302383 [Ascobolus immersus RN42]|uniref:Uncharacterized protein n=1 Tax=Ascobolus immersus RN42 TaxID=1160509 RepID=A0A3N4IWK2_ASCIM|nr:hypothetical protein BJ508DRAFT_302383 [Ascobolus immersus RN42]